MKDFENQMLESHNQLRALHGSPPLRPNAKLSKLALNWAKVLAEKEKLEHDPKWESLKLGENVAMKYQTGFTDFPGDVFSKMWYDEIKQYKWTGKDQLECGHFTQLVWRSSTEVGFGRAVSKSGRVYVVGRYQPPGNYSGEFGKNVLPTSNVPNSNSNLANSGSPGANEKKPSSTEEANSNPEPEHPGL